MFAPFKISKDPIPAGLRCRVIYKFSRVGCGAFYAGETNRHFATRICEHFSSCKHSHIFKDIRGSDKCRSLCSDERFEILDSASTSFKLKIEETTQILWEQPSLFIRLTFNLSFSHEVVSVMLGQYFYFFLLIPKYSKFHHILLNALLLIFKYYFKNECEGFIRFPNARNIWNNEAVGEVALLFSSVWKQNETRSSRFWNYFSNKEND